MDASMSQQPPTLEDLSAAICAKTSLTPWRFISCTMSCATVSVSVISPLPLLWPTRPSRLELTCLTFQPC